MYTGKKVCSFQDRFTQLVKESGKSLLELSNELHVSNQTLSAWRTGTRSPKEPTIIAVAKHFRVHVQWLMGFDVEKEDDSRAIYIPESDVFHKILLGMTPDDYRIVMNIFEKTERDLKARGEW